MVRAEINKVTEMVQTSVLFESRNVVKLVVGMSVLTLLLFVVYQAPINPLYLVPRASRGVSGFSSVARNVTDARETKLQKVLDCAAMDDKTVILTTLNEAWAKPGSMLDLFLESFRIGNKTQRLLRHLVIVALDQKAYDRCLDVHAHCLVLTTEGVDFSEEAYFMTPDYLKMMWRRIDFLRTVLEMGFNFIFTDADIMWFRNPTLRFYPDTDFQIACDHFNGNSYDANNMPNGGFNYVKSNNRTVEFYKFWYNSRTTYPRLHDQDVLNRIKKSSFIRKLGLTIRFLDTAYFGGLCEPSRDLNVVCTMHANCCYGLDSKLQDLGIMLEDWRKFMALTPELKLSKHASWRVPHNCSLSSYHRFHAKKKVPEQVKS